MMKEEEEEKEEERMGEDQLDNEEAVGGKQQNIPRKKRVCLICMVQFKWQNV